MNTEQEQLITSFDWNGSTTLEREELKDMMEIFSNSFDDIYEESEVIFEQNARGRSFLLSFF